MITASDCYFRDRCGAIPPVDPRDWPELTQQSGRQVTAAALAGNEPANAMRSRWLVAGLVLLVARLLLG